MKERNKHIVFVNHTREQHGSEQVMLETLRQCRTQGWRVTVVLPCNQPDGGLAKAIGKEANILYLNYKNVGESLLRTIAIEFYNLLAVIRLSRWIRKNRVDVIYSNTSVTLLGIEAARWTKTPHVWHWHELPSKEFGWSKSVLQILQYWKKYTSKLLFISDTQKQLWENALGKSHIDNAQVIYNPIRTIHAIPKKDPKCVRIGYIGSFMERKNLSWLIQIVAQLADEYDLHLSLYGAKDPQEKESIQMQYKNIPALTVHEFTDDIESVYSNLDIFVLPSWSETMPLVVLEAMQAGVCVIQTANSGMVEIMHDGEECLFIRPEEKESLIEALIRCLDPVYRARIAQQGQRFATQWIAKNNYQRRIIAVFKSLIKEA